MIQVLPYATAAFPLALVCVMSVVWWNVLVRPWLFLAIGSLTLYGLIALAVGALVLIGPSFGGYFLEVPLQPGERSLSMDPLTITLVIALIAILIVGIVILWGLKQWLFKR